MKKQEKPDGEVKELGERVQLYQEMGGCDWPYHSSNLSYLWHEPRFAAEAVPSASARDDSADLYDALSPRWHGVLVGLRPCVAC